MTDGPKWRLVAGLGNPGRQYAATRHNVGFMVIDRLAEQFSIATTRRNIAEIHYGSGYIEGVRIILAKPLAYMNNSGPPIRRLADYYDISPADMLVVHDDIDLAFGRMKIIEKGGHGGHKGIKSLMSSFGGNSFPRIRLGIGRSSSGKDVADYVLSDFAKAEREDLRHMIDSARDAVVSALTRGLTETMNRFNRKEGI